MNIDIFNGDADGLCALIQLRLANPRDCVLITGIKRDIALLAKVKAAAGDEITVLDISLDKNRTALTALLTQGATVFYIDHHQADPIPQHPKLTSLINTDANTCTGLLVNAYLNDRFPLWAIVAAFGDNLSISARQLANRSSLSEYQVNTLEQLGICLNYNSYGESLEDLHFAPDELYRLMSPFASPFDFIEAQPAIYRQLLTAYREDLELAWQIPCELANDAVSVYILPYEKWARRVSGVWGNELANRHPDKAHAILTVCAEGGYQVSVRAPLNHKTGADELCRCFPTGGGRKAAAGINHLPDEQLAVFIEAFVAKYSSH